MNDNVLKANGRLSTTFIMSLQRFIPRQQWERLEHLQGSQLYADFLRRLEPNGRFSLHPTAATLEEQGHALGIFRRRLLNSYFFPTYVPDTAWCATFNAALQANLNHDHPWPNDWSFSLRLTRTGQVIVNMVWEVDNVPLTEITRTLLALQGAIPYQTAGNRMTQWQVAMEIVAAFTHACGGEFVIEHAKNGRFRRPTTRIQLNKNYDTEPYVPLHDRHITFLFNQFTCNGTPVTADELRQSFAPQLFGLLQNNLMAENGRYTYPTFTPQTVQTLFHHDHANWHHELCLLTAETSLIYAPAIPHATPYFDGSHLIDQSLGYDHYWQAIARGIEFVATLKSEVQMIERLNTSQLERVPDLTAKVADGNLSRTDTKAILNMAQNIGRLFHMLPHMRDVLVPSSVFRTTHATQIFHHAMTLLGIHDIERHIETNVSELNAFIAYYNGMQLQYDAQKTNRTVLTLTIVFSILTLLFSLIAIPSFFQDGVGIHWFAPLPETTQTVWQVPPALAVLQFGLLALAALFALIMLSTLLTRLYNRYRGH